MAVKSHDIVLVSHAGAGGDIHEILKGPKVVARGRCVRVQAFQGRFEGFPITSTIAIESLPKVTHGTRDIIYDGLHFLTVAESAASGESVVFKQEIGDRVVSSIIEVGCFVRARVRHIGWSRD